MAKISVNIENRDIYVIESLKSETSILNNVSYIDPNDKVVTVDKPNSNVCYLVVFPS